jgi:hypothetical protein
VRQVQRQRHPPRLVVLDVHDQIHRPIYSHLDVSGGVRFIYRCVSGLQ